MSFLSDNVLYQEFPCRVIWYIQMHIKRIYIYKYIVMEDITALKQNKTNFSNRMLYHKRPFTNFNTLDNMVSIDQF